MDDPTRQLAPYFRAVCIEIRTRQDATTGEVAALAGVEPVSIDRFEAGKTFPTSNLETYAAAYAALDDIDPRELLYRVIDYWIERGRPPLTAKQAKRLSEAPDPFSPQALLAHIIQAERQHAQRRAKGAKRPNATRRKRAGGE